MFMAQSDLELLYCCPQITFADQGLGFSLMLQQGISQCGMALGCKPVKPDIVMDELGLAIDEIQRSLCILVLQQCIGVTVNQSAIMREGLQCRLIQPESVIGLPTGKFDACCKRFNHGS